MNSQLYTAASGLLAEQRRLELIANNLANISTPGYRARRAFSTSYQRFGPSFSDVIRTANDAVAIAGSYETPSAGPRRVTGGPLDLALPPGFHLVVETPAGRRYTRDGSLHLSPAGGLVDGRGHPILGAGGKPITGAGAASRITADGKLAGPEGQGASLMVVRDPENVLRPEGNNLLTAGGEDARLVEAPRPEVSPGYLEGSGTDALGELVSLIEAQRAFESYQKLVSLTMNEVNRRAVNDIAG